ncbi:MAG: cytochrome c oxidase assembly protein [Actinomycetota bacterium]
MGALPAFHVHLDVLLVLGSVQALYLIALRRRRRSLQLDPSRAAAAARAEGLGDPVASRRQVTLFSAGMIVLLLGATWPVHDLAERYLYSAHMLQHLLFTLVAAPLLLSGTPAWLLRSILKPRWAFASVRVLTKPLVAIVVYNGVLLFTHWPEIVDASVGSELLHFSLHVLILASAIVLWWPVVSPLPELPPLAPPAQMLYVFINSLAPTIPASFLTFGREPLYKVYESFPRIWGIGALDDQLVAGLLMKIGGGLLLWGVITAIFFRWFAQEQRDEGDALQWRTFETKMRAEMRR